jgi:hypothetical protein
MPFDDYRLRISNRIVRRPLREKITTENTENTEDGKPSSAETEHAGAYDVSSLHGAGILQRETE